MTGLFSQHKVTIYYIKQDILLHTVLSNTKTFSRKKKIRIFPDRNRSSKQHNKTKLQKYIQISTMEKLLQYGILISLFINITAEKCCSDRRCRCIPVRNNSFGNDRFEARCVGFVLNTSTFPKFWPNVESVVLNNNSITDMPFPITKYLPETVIRLEITNNNINYLRESSFTGLKKLSHLVLRENKIQHINIRTFTTLPFLKNLDLSNNRGLTFRALRNISYGLQFTDIQVLYLNALHCSSGITTILLKADFEYLKNTSLTELYLRENKLGYVQTGTISGLPKTLSKIDLSFNALSIGPYYFEMLTMTSLTYLNIGDRSSFGGIKSISDCHDWRCPDIEEDTNKMWNVNYDFFKIPMPPNLKEIFLKDSKFYDDIDDITVTENNILEKIDARGNLLQRWIGPIKNLHKLKYLDLSNVGGKVISNYFFSDFPVLESLKINYNSFGSLFAEDENGKIFQFLNALKYLEFTNNLIFVLPKNIFKNLSSLEMLDISSNYLTKWNISISHMKNLKVLDLSSNRLTSFSSITMKEIDNHLLKHHLNISLKDNVLQCTCKTLNFMSWMLENSHIFVDFNSYKCQDENKHNIPFTKANFLDLQKQCSVYTGLIIGLCVAVVTCIISAILGVLYRYRWKLRYLYYMGRQRQTINYEGKQLFEFDAFISYAEEDSNTVAQITEILENKYNFRLQLHQRDFIAGKSVAENITDTIHKCHKTVIMLSKNFLSSNWCMFEFHMARMESIYARKGGNVIIIVLLEPIRSRDMPMMMMDVIQSDSYVEYPDNKQDQLLFWEKLQNALKF